MDRRATGVIRRIRVLAGALAALGPASTGLAAQPPFPGHWASANGKTYVRIERCGSDFCGVNTWVRPGVSSEKVGDRLVAKVEHVGHGRWSGTAFDP